jgi:hypothetical protein
MASELRLIFLAAPPLFSQEALPLLVTSLNSFRKPHPTPKGVFAVSSEIRETLISADVESLEESCALLESLSLDVEDVRLSLARGLTFPDEHDGVPCLSDMLNFLDCGDYPPWWADDPDRAAYERGFENCKSGIIRAVVEVAGEQKNTYILWDESEDDKPGGEFVSWMIQWIRKADQKGKEGLVICATLTIGNLVRRGESFVHTFLRSFVEPALSILQRPTPTRWLTRPSPSLPTLQKSWRVIRTSRSSTE